MPTCSRSLFLKKMRSLSTIGLTATFSVLLLSACLPPPPGVHETLTISDQGEFSLNGVSVPREQLRSSLTAEQRRVKTLFAEIVASPRSDIEAVKYAVEALKTTQVRFAFIDEQIKNSGKSKTPGDPKPD
jgi:hypothetical protein